MFCEPILGKPIHNNLIILGYNYDVCCYIYGVFFLYRTFVLIFQKVGNFVLVAAFFPYIFYKLLICFII